MADDEIGTCWHCGRRLTGADYGREATCLGCGKATRVCRNCRHYAPGRPNECREPQVERVLAKDRANFCELFDPSDQPLGASDSPNQETLRAAVEGLFRD